jgi:hypothetical protein
LSATFPPFVRHPPGWRENPKVISRIKINLSTDFPKNVASSIFDGMEKRLKSLGSRG